MKPGVWSYENVEKQAVWFRGYVKIYRGHNVEEVPCGEVWSNKKKALDDAKKLMLKLKSVDKRQ